VSGRRADEENLVNYVLVEEGINMEYPKKDSDMILFTDEKKFTDFHSRIHHREVPKPKPPQVDFDSHFVVFITYGQQPSAGYFIQVRSVLRRDETAAVRALLNEPPQDSFQAQALTHPYVFIQIPRENFTRVEWTSGIGEVLFSKPL
jgi:hypothetical protein